MVTRTPETYGQEALRVMRHSTAEWARPAVLVALLLGVGLLARLWRIDAPLQGDDYNSLREATFLGQNLNGLLYFVLLHFWMQPIQAEWWYRLLAVLLGLCAIPIAYWAGTLLAGRRAGLIAAALFSIAPFAVDTTHQVRGYSLFLTTSVLALAATLFFLSSANRRRRWLWLGISLVLLPLSHIFGLLLAGVLLLFLYILRGRWPASLSTRWILACLGLACLLAILLWPTTRFYGWQLLQRSIGALRLVDYQSTRGLSAAQFVKIPLALYVFTFSYSVYPLIWLFVIPAFLVILIVAIAGLIALRKQAPALALLLAILGLVPFVFLVLDAIVPAYTETAGPRHVTMTWPAFALLLAVGASRARNGILTLPLLLVAAIGLGVNWSSDWSYAGESAGPDWHAAADFAASAAAGPTAVLYDGRSQDPITFYFPAQLRRIGYWDYLQGNDLGDLLTYNRIIFLTNDYQVERRQGFDQLLDRLKNRFNLIGGRVEYPLFEYVFERKRTDGAADAVMPANGQIRQPLRTYGLEFQDLRLPLTIEVDGTPLTVAGAFGLPDLLGAREQTIALDDPPLTDRLVLLSTVVGAEDLKPGSPVAEVVAESDRGERQVFPLRMGMETQDWSRACPPAAACKTVYQWHKRIAFVGQQGYPGAWRDFRAGLHGVVVNLPPTTRVRRITLRYLASSGRLSVWGLAVPPQRLQQ